MVSAPVLIKEGRQAVEDKSRGHKIVSKVDEFEDSPSVEHGEGTLADAQQPFMQNCPLSEGVVPLLGFALLLQDDVLQLVLPHTLHIRLLAPRLLLHLP